MLYEPSVLLTEMFQPSEPLIMVERLGIASKSKVKLNDDSVQFHMLDGRVQFQPLEEEMVTLVLLLSQLGKLQLKTDGKLQLQLKLLKLLHMFQPD